MSISLAPDYWGKPLWTSMYSMAYVYPDTPTAARRTAANNFYKSLAELIPCESCREHYTQLLAKHPIEASTANKKDLLKWLETISTLVNERIGKGKFDPTPMYKEMEDAVLVPDTPEPVQKTAPLPQPKPQPRAAPRPRPRAAPRPQPRATPRAAAQQVAPRAAPRAAVRGPQLRAAPRPPRKPCNCGKRRVQAKK